MAKTHEKVRLYEGSGNAFEDLSLPDARELNVKVQLCTAINRIVSNRELSEADVAVALCIDQPTVFALQNHRLNNLTVEQLMRFITKLDYDVIIKITPPALPYQLPKSRYK